jgi:hypothetical protein
MRKKIYRSKDQLTSRFLSKNRKLTAWEKQTLAIAPLAHLEALRQGGAREDWEWVVDCINVAKIISRSDKYTQEVMDVLEVAEQALVALRDRFKAGKALAFTAQELSAVRGGVTLAVEIYEICTKAEFDDAYDFLRNYLKNHGTKEMMIG